MEASGEEQGVQRKHLVELLFCSGFSPSCTSHSIWAHRVQPAQEAGPVYLVGSLLQVLGQEKHRPSSLLCFMKPSSDGVANSLTAVWCPRAPAATGGDIVSSPNIWWPARPWAAAAVLLQCRERLAIRETMGLVTLSAPTMACTTRTVRQW